MPETDLEEIALRTLIVDDEPDIRELLEITLGRMKLDTRSARNVKEAREWLAREPFDLCLTDMRLPDGSTVATALNFATEPVETTVRTELFAVGAEAQDLWTDVPLGVVDGVHGLRLALAGHEARVLRIGPEAGDARSGGR